MLNWIARCVCWLFGHDVRHEVWEVHSHEYWTPEVEEVFWCDRCGKYL